MELIKLHVGCGTVKLDGYVNIDLRMVDGVTDVIASCDNLPYSENTVDEIVSYHLIEHFDEPEAKKILGHWHSLLKDGGICIIETPDVIEMARKMISVHETMQMVRPGYIYGCHDKAGRETIVNDNHKWGYTQESLRKYLLEVGFKYVSTSYGTDYHATGSDPKLFVRAEAIK